LALKKKHEALRFDATVGGFGSNGLKQKVRISKSHIDIDRALPIDGACSDRAILWPRLSPASEGLSIAR
jgi:hypothetical protein